MKKTVDYTGRTSCACPHLNNPDPQAHWKDCGYRLNASQPQPQPAEVEQPEVVGAAILGGLFHGGSGPELGGIDVELNPDVLERIQQELVQTSDDIMVSLITLPEHHRITAQLRADRDEWRKIAHQLEQANAGIAQLNGQLRAECERMRAYADGLQSMASSVGAAMKAERDQLRARVGELEADNSSLRGSCKQLGEENKHLKRQVKKAQRELAALNPAPANKGNEA